MRRRPEYTAGRDRVVDDSEKSRDRKFLNEDGTREGEGLGKITAT